MAGRDVGNDIVGLVNNYAMGSVEVAQGSDVVFFDQFDNDLQGQAPCSEALYVRQLILRAGAIVTLDDTTIYFESLVDEGATINLLGGARLVPLPTCNNHDDCNDIDACTADRCVGGACTHVPTLYGDVDHNGTVDLFDLFCVLNGFSGDFSVCSFADIDIEPCEGDDDIDLFDLFAVLNAFSGVDPCCGGLP